MDIYRFRREFPITENKIFFNHAAVSPLPIRAAKAMRNFVEDVVEAQLRHGVDLERGRRLRILMGCLLA